MTLKDPGWSGFPRGLDVFWWASTASIATLAVALQMRIFDRTAVAMDEGQLAAVATRILDGEVLYRDIHTGIGPGIYHVTAALFAFFGRELLVTTFFVRVTGDSMIDAGIHSGDLLIVDRALEPSHKSVVVAVINGELTVKRLYTRNGKVCLVPDNAQYPSLPIHDAITFEIWGVVTAVIHPV